MHPETYAVVEQIMAKAGQPVAALHGTGRQRSRPCAELFANEQFGVITVKDIAAELEKPGRDPRPDFQSSALQRRGWTTSATCAKAWCWKPR
ncbi:MAG: hypothetical protein R3E42_06635 [Burkholderiaceae bacterium]